MRQSAPLVVLCSLLSSIAGCTKPPVGIVTGTVSYQEKPLSIGSVTLMGADDRPFQGQIQADGRFSIEGVPYGTYRVIVFTGDFGQEPKRPARSENTKPRKEFKPPDGWVAIPKRYSKIDESGLSCVVERDKLNFEIKLTE